MDARNEMMTDGSEESERILFLPQNPHDADTAQGIFEDADLEMTPCRDLAEVLEEIDAGAGVIIVAEEKLEVDEFDEFVSRLRAQPAWADLPILVVTRSGKAYGACQRLGEVANVTLVERPVHFKPLVSTVRAALRDRIRQYEIRRSIANRDRFLAMLGHELRNPLAAIVLGLERMGYENDNPALEIIRRQTGNLERIVDDLLEVSRISRGVISFDKKPVDLIPIIGETVDAFDNIASDEGIELDLELSDVDSLWVNGDSVRLEQVLGNLLSNAVRYTPSGGRVQVEAGRQGDQVVIAVCDTGMGIPHEQLESIFELFAQAHDDFSRREGGLGLGLSLAHNIIKMHDGEILADSDGEGQGSTFTIRLPAVEKPEASPQTARPDPPTRAQHPSSRDTMRLLVVEDVDDVRVPFCEMLRLRGFEVDEAATGSGGVDAYQQGRYQAILLDIGLPDLDGYQVARRLRDGGYEGPLFALTGYGRKQDREQALEAGFDDLLTKPVSFDELKEVLSVASVAPV